MEAYEGNNAYRCIIMKHGGAVHAGNNACRCLIMKYGGNNEWGA